MREDFISAEMQIQFQSLKANISGFVVDALSKQNLNKVIDTAFKKAISEIRIDDMVRDVVQKQIKGAIDDAAYKAIRLNEQMASALEKMASENIQRQVEKWRLGK